MSQVNTCENPLKFCKWFSLPKSCCHLKLWLISPMNPHYWKDILGLSLLNWHLQNPVSSPAVVGCTVVEKSHYVIVRSDESHCRLSTKTKHLNLGWVIWHIINRDVFVPDYPHNKVQCTETFAKRHVTHKGHIIISNVFSLHVCQIVLIFTGTIGSTSQEITAGINMYTTLAVFGGAEWK